MSREAVVIDNANMLPEGYYACRPCCPDGCDDTCRPGSGYLIALELAFLRGDIEGVNALVDSAACLRCLVLHLLHITVDAFEESERNGFEHERAFPGLPPGQSVFDDTEAVQRLDAWWGEFKAYRIRDREQSCREAVQGGPLR